MLGWPALSSRDSTTGPKRASIVVFKSTVTDVSASTAKRERRDAFRSQRRFTRAIRGFSARLTSRQIERLEADPAVEFVAPDRPVQVFDAPVAAGDQVTVGLRRIGAATTSTAQSASGVNVAVVDTGIDLDHPDLNARDGTDCVMPGTTAEDEHGHGTHVAGRSAPAITVPALSGWRLGPPSTPCGCWTPAGRASRRR